MSFSKKKGLGMIAALAVLGAICEASLFGSAGDGEELNIACTSSMLAHVNETDAVAAMQTWVGMLKEVWDSTVPSTVKVYKNDTSLKRVMEDEAVDLISLRTDEFFRLRELVALDSMYIGTLNGKSTVETMVLVHRDSAFRSLDDLKGARLQISAADRLGLGELWLEALLLKQGKGLIADHFYSLDIRPKSAGAVHSVFFKTTDACLVTRRNFELLAELNPQIGKMLRVVEVSPPLIPALICMRQTYDDEAKHDLAKAITHLHETPRGQQMLTFFNSDKMVPVALDELEDTRLWIEAHEKLTARFQAGNSLSANGHSVSGFQE